MHYTLGPEPAASPPHISSPAPSLQVHYTMSKSMEGYFQEAGRAGRDDKPSNCIVFYAPKDKSRVMNLIRMGEAA